jgi:hypothetical protein
MAVECKPWGVPGRVLDGIRRGRGGPPYDGEPFASTVADDPATGRPAFTCEPSRIQEPDGTGKKVKKPKKSRSTLPVPVRRRRDSVDVLERVLTKGAQVKGVDAPVDEEANDSEAGGSAWLRITVAGVNLLNVQTGLSWRPLGEPDEPRPTTE